ncbi:MAG: cell division protein ZapE [Methylococcales bacterium]
MLRSFFQDKYDTPLSSQSAVLERDYHLQVAQNRIQFDNTQLEVLQDLQKIIDQLELSVAHYQKSLHQKLFSSPPKKSQSVYLYGEVGRGKSMLMSLFYEACPIEQKRRVPFSQFMLEAHAFIHAWRRNHDTDAIVALAKAIRSQSQVLCIDEFHVTDIADAMMLERLFSQLFDLDTLVVFTSNRHPDDLYQGGLQKEQFVKFTQLLKDEAKIIELAAQKDYRLIHLQALEVSYYSPLDAHANKFIKERYDEFTDGATINPSTLPVLGRNVLLSSIHDDVALTSFDELCAQPLGSIDYIEIAQTFNLIIMANIPQLSPEKRNEAKRFVLLIDALYEHKVKLICTAEVSPDALYPEGDGVFEFKRTVSRLIEMQSKSYLHATNNILKSH